MPGDFVVCKHGEGKHDIFYFCGWGNPDILTMSDMPIVSRKLSQVMWFEYESTAQEVADVLGDGWHVIDAAPEEDRHRAYPVRGTGLRRLRREGRL